MLLGVENESVSNLKGESSYDIPGEVVDDDGISGAGGPKEILVM